MPPHAPALSLTDWIVLGLVAEESRHGFAVAHELKAGSGLGSVWTVHRPLVYRAIDRLEALGLLERARTEPGRQGPDRTLLRATSRGKRSLERWLAEPIDHPRSVRNELLAKLVLLTRRGDAVSSLARRQHERFAPVLESMEASAARTAGVDRIVASWRVESMRATQRFLEQVERGELSPVTSAEFAR